MYGQLNRHNITLFCSDCWKTYQEVIPSHKHQQSKKETFTIESHNGRIHHYLARFKRKGKCYTKCHKMTENSLNLLFC
ncbi:IS1 family transposase [Moraxella oblonga]|uniref:IS1 family transposase n=1 Tax=Moraxella oblonga TaxID=200413 RepID=UPI003F6FE227